ncbi:hypothetical protein M514_00761 [Trichuris suis]|uniref:Uncharacterized protein n=1 Tax=Trichuris suis TaxID=68888 RepID=A0A085N9E5_9BILA|nr:hypothetical protein M514_00761 [Trichuris suis]KHJ42801.1 hypothetical protein D918_07083 [Trichuris suis]
MTYKDMCERKEDVLSMRTRVWISDPFSSVDGTEMLLQEELTQQQANEELKPSLQDDILASGCSNKSRTFIPDYGTSLRSSSFLLFHLTWSNVDLAAL